jgi:hypothetical protein
VTGGLELRQPNPAGSRQGADGCGERERKPELDARNFFQGPGSWNQDLSVFKNFSITETVRLRFAADFFTAFNHPVDVIPNASTGLQDLSTQLNEPRIIQLSLAAVLVAPR